MSYESTVLITLILYKLVLIGIGLLARRWTRDESDFLLGGRSMGPLVASISAAASSSSAWSLIGVAYAAYSSGLGALWIFPACVGGFFANWFLLAPALRRVSAGQGSLTATEVLAMDAEGRRRPRIARLATLFVLACFLTYVAAQYQAAGKAFEANFGTSPVLSILVGAGIVLVYTMLGGFWAVSLTDTLQGLLMALVALVLPVVALVELGGFSALYEGLAQDPTSGTLTSLSSDKGFPAAIGFVLGWLGIGFGYPGQPHVVNRFMALRDDRAVVAGRRITIAWALVLYSGMLLLGLCGRVLYPGTADAETLLFTSAKDLLHPIVAGVVVAALLSAVMSTADSQLLVAASSVSHDWKGGEPDPARALRTTRLVVLGVSLAAVISAFVWPEKIFDKVLSAWSALGAAFGPLLLVRCLRGPISERATLLAMGCGFSCSIGFFVLRKSPLAAEWGWPASYGSALEYLGSFGLALAIAWSGSRRPGSEGRAACA